MFAHDGTVPDGSMPNQHLTGTAPRRRTVGRLALSCTLPEAEV